MTGVPFFRREVEVVRARPLLMTVKTIGVLRGTDAFDSLNLKSVMVTVTLTGVATLLPRPHCSRR